jgi:Tfp pilus assembly protein PilF
MNTDFNRDAHFGQAMSYFMNNNLGDSIQLLDEIVAEVPTDKMAYLTRGSAHLKLGQTDSSIRDFSRAIEIDAGYAKAYHMRAWPLRRLETTAGRCRILTRPSR